jgi:glycosyltransferase involved in cell wall biosynthesis
MRDNQRRVLMIGPSPEMHGGTSAVEQVLLEAWPGTQYRVHYIATAVDGPKWLKLTVVVKALLEFLASLVIYRPDILHVNLSSHVSFYRKSLFILIAHLFQLKTVIHSHASSFHIFYEAASDPIRRWYIRYILNLATRMLVLAKVWQEFFSRLYTRGEPVIVYNPIRCPDLPIAQKPDSHIVLELGRLGQRKGTYDLLRAVPIVTQSHPEAQFWLGGDGEVEKVRQSLSSAPWGKNVRLLGWVKDEAKDEALSRAAVFVLPSYSEGLPLAILEAMTYGLPVVSTPVGGIPMAVLDGETGFLVQPGDVEAIAQRIILLLNDPELRSRMGANAQRHVKEKFEVSAVIQQLFAVYDSMMSES